MTVKKNNEFWKRYGTVRRGIDRVAHSHLRDRAIGTNEDEEDMYYSDPEGPYIDEPIADEEWLTEYNRELEEIERRNQELQNRFDRIVEPKTW